MPTRAQLADQFQDVARLSRELSMVPEGQGGMLSVAVAKLAAALKVWWVVSGGAVPPRGGVAVGQGGPAGWYTQGAVWVDTACCHVVNIGA